MANYKLVLCYDGTRYSGWQKQGNTSNTIQEKLEALLSRLLEQPVELSGSGRTDAGVHARMQVCSFHAKTPIEPRELLGLLRRYLPEDIGAYSLELAPPRFHARLSCREKTYVYSIWNSELPNVFERRYMLAFPGELDIKAMERGAQLLCGEHDFTSFCANRHMKKSAVRNIKEIRFKKEGERLSIILRGNGFLYNMVRIIVGTLLEIGTGVRSFETIPEILLAKDRSKAGPTAAAHGLCLYDVGYD